MWLLHQQGHHVHLPVLHLYIVYKYRQVYDDYKHRIEHMDAHKEKSKGHRHNMAVRYMIKIFLIDLYNEWRRIEGLPVAPTYSEAKLGKVHGKAA